VLYVDPRTGASDLVIDPSNPNKLFAGMWQFRRWPWFFKSGGPGSGIYVTWDGGKTWKPITQEDGLPKGDLGRIGLAISRSHPEVVYAAVEAEKSAVVRSDNGGRTWKIVNQRYDADPRPFYFSHLRVDPELPEPRLPAGLQRQGIERRLQVIRGPHPRFPHPRRLPCHLDRPHNPKLIYLGNDGGVAVSRDRGQTAAFVATLPLAHSTTWRSTCRRPTTSTAACRTTAPGVDPAPSGRRGNSQP